MLGWAIKKGFQSATGLDNAPEAADGDTTQIDIPDTPAPVFAARAIRNALWGQSAPQDQIAPVETRKRSEPPTLAAPITSTNAIDAESNDFASPTKPAGILLTPGTATARRKRVSFGHDVKAGNNSVECSPSVTSSANRQRKKTALQQVLENSRTIKPNKEVEKPEEPAPVAESLDDISEDDWEDDVCNHDVTVDLNEPHSESGKYWKSEFERYREEAKSDIERLVKYKALAKSFAAKKDAEANGLSQKLKEEQAKVIEMEERITGMASQITGKRGHGEGGENGTLMKDLAKQTTLAAQYREQVKELESLLKDTCGEANPNQSDRQHQKAASGADSTAEIQQELKKVKSELKHMERLREDVNQLKAELAKSRQEVARLEEDKSAGGVTESSRVQRLEKKLREVKDESRQKDTELRKLRRDYESLKRDAKNRTAEALQVLHDKNEKIAELESNIKTLEEAKASSGQVRDLDAVIAEHKRITRDLKSGIESLNRPYRHDKNKSLRRPKRSASVEDMTLDMTQRSLLGDRNEDPVDSQARKSQATRRPFADLTDSLFNIEEELKKEKEEHAAVSRRERELIMDDFDDAPSPPAQKTRDSIAPSRSRRVMSDGLSNRANELSPKDTARRYRPAAKDQFSLSDRQDRGSRRVASTQSASTAEDKAMTMRGALERPSYRARSQTNANRPPSPEDDEPCIDLMQDRFARLGGPSAEPAKPAPSTRCTLSADRQAAARARLEQKRMQRQRATGRMLDKEHLRPRLLA
ncbi:spindle pole body formation-associated protein-domain-containing protein [Biscogniauxia sp. FL1348]|nr:spindle pole body formation-associated protein-domain-containing protein [Biscogniauxia sp. FL1348]